MTGRKHRSNMELIAQGLANIASALFGGISVTGTIARTATNVRAGGVSPLSGMMHSAFLLIFILVAAPLASFVPLAALAGLTLARDLTSGIVGGCMLAALFAVFKRWVPEEGN
jgi:SulP family sulfate permease